MLEFEFIVNPKSGHNRAGRMWETFHSQHPEIAPGRVHWTERRGHAEEIARDLRLQGVTRMVAVGGDGLLNEVVNGLFDQEDVGQPRAKLHGRALGHLRSGGHIHQRLHLPHARHHLALLLRERTDTFESMYIFFSERPYSAVSNSRQWPFGETTHLPGIKTP